jgi:UDP-N-acetyl-D-glucosamine dehydrogenase
MSYVVAACEQAAQYLHPGMLVSLESTTFPGTTDELMLPMLQAAHPDLQVGYDFFLCFSPERVDPGNPMYNTSNTPKVVGGVTSQCTNAGAALYRTVVSKVIPVRGTRVAEMVKLLENTFRLINIGLVNEMAMMCDRMGVDIWEVIKAASTKPFGFMPFYPGMGVGGHCIAVDPFYLAWKTRQIGVEPRFIDLAGQVNGQMPHHAVRKIAAILNSAKKSVNGAKIHIMGMAYKRDIDDVRESPALDVTHLLLEDGAEITYYDPYVPTVVIGGVVYASCSEEIHRACIEAADCVVIAAAHTNVDYPFVLRTARAIFDPHNMLGGCPDEMGKLKVTH